MGTGSHRYRVTLDSGNFFYLAAIWDPPCADWPLSYRILTIPAGADVIPYQSRHGVIIERSEEHTSELQSLMRISYAVFCLKKQNKIRNNKHELSLIQVEQNSPTS